MEEREEGVFEGVEPVFVVVFEREGGGFLAGQERKGSRHCLKDGGGDYGG